MVRRQAWRRPSESSGEPWMPQLLWRPIKNGASLPQWGEIKQLGPFAAYLEKKRKLSIIQNKSSQVLKVLPSLAIVWPQDSVAITCCWFFQSHICHIYTRHIGTVLEPKKGEWLKVATWPSHVSVELRDRTMSNSSSLSKAGKALRRHMESKGGRKKGCWNSTTRTESPKAIGFGFLFSPASPCIVKKKDYTVIGNHLKCLRETCHEKQNFGWYFGEARRMQLFRSLAPTRYRMSWFVGCNVTSMGKVKMCVSFRTWQRVSK